MPVSTLTAVTVAEATGEPPGSDTRPRMLPVTVWPGRGAGSNSATVASMPHDQTKRFIRTISGMWKGTVFGRVKHGRPRRGRQSAPASHLRHGGPAPADPPGVNRDPQEDDQEREPRLPRVRPQRVSEHEE